VGRVVMLRPHIAALDATRTQNLQPTSTSWKRWYKTSRWQALRARQLREEPLCRMCKPAIVEARVCDHIEPHRGDPVKFWKGPFQSLCVNCHSSAKQRIENGRNVPRGCDENGYPTGGEV